MSRFWRHAAIAVAIGFCSASLVTPSFAQSQSLTGFNGADATTSGARGGDGQDANLSGGSNNIILTTQGGNGGAGGSGSAASPGSTAIAPGAGGNGGNASANAFANTSTGPASATANATAGLGGQGGSGASASQPNGVNGCDGNANAYANAYGQDNSTVMASASAIGGVAAVGAFGRSDGGGTVNASASLTQNGDAFLNNAADGQTTGSLFLTQNVTARTGSATGSSAGNAFNSLSETRYGLTLLSASISATGANGGSLDLPGGAGVASLSLTSNSPIVASESATGGNGGNGGTFAYWGLSGIVEANINSIGNSTSNSSASLDAHVTGGNGAAGTLLGGGWAFGGNASAQLSVVAAGNASLHLTLNPGNGGAGVGMNNYGGAAGSADIENGDLYAASMNGGAVDLAVTVHAGNGGDGIAGAFAAPGADAALHNVGNTYTTGTLSISQNAVAGNGGSVRSDVFIGMAGNGGNAQSEIYRDDANINPTNPLITLNASATGGNGGNLSGAGTTYFSAGQAGVGTVNIADSANHSISASGQSVGGDAGADHGSQLMPGGQAWTMINVSSNGSAVGDTVSANAAAKGGAGDGSTDSTYYNNAARAIAFGTASGHANAVVTASAIGGNSEFGCGGWAYSTGSATLNGDGTLLSATATSTGGNGGGPYYASFAGGEGIAAALISSPTGIATAEAIGGNSISPVLRGGGAGAEVDAGALRIIEQADPISMVGGHAKVSYINGRFTSLLATHPSLTIYGTGSASTDTLNGVSTLTIGDNAILKIAAGYGSDSVTTLAFSQNGKLDLTDNTLTLNDGYPASTHLSDTRSDLAGGELFSSSSNASHALGYAASNTTLTVKLTYLGDANLDGKVDVTDLGLLASHWQQSGYWSGGDFNYDGSVNVVDLGLLATNWQRGTTLPSAMSFEQALALVNLTTSSVPEPSTVGAVAFILLQARRRRRLNAR